VFIGNEVPTSILVSIGDELPTSILVFIGDDLPTSIQVLYELKFQYTVGRNHFSEYR
jgi:hypothetical protein